MVYGQRQAHGSGGHDGRGFGNSFGSFGKELGVFQNQHGFGNFHMGSPHDSNHKVTGMQDRFRRPTGLGSGVGKFKGQLGW